MAYATKHIIEALYIALLGCLLAPAVLAQAPENPLAETTPVPPAKKIDLAEIESRLAAIEDSATLSAESKEELAESYRQAQQLFEKAQADAARREDLTAAAEAAPQRLEELQAILSAPPEPLASPPADDAPLEVWEHYLRNRDQELQASRDGLIALETERQRRLARRLEIANRVKALPDEIAAAQQELAGLNLGENPNETMRARQAVAQAQLAALNAEQNLYEAELRAFEATSALAPLERDLAVRQVVNLEQSVRELREQVSRKRGSVWDTRLRTTQSEATQTTAVLAPLAEGNIALAEDGRRVSRELQKTNEELTARQQQLLDLNQRITRVMGRVESIGLSRSVGMLLRYEREALTDYSHLQQRTWRRQRTINQLLLEMMDLEERRSDLSNLEQAKLEALAEIEYSSSGAGDAIEMQTLDLLETRKELLAALIGEYREYINQLLELNQQETSLIQKTKTFTDYIEERIFWVRSASVFGPEELRQMLEPAGRLSEPAGWQQIGTLLAADMGSALPVWLLALLVVIAIAVLRPLWRKRLEELGNRAERGSCVDYLPTLQALGYTLLLALPVPAGVSFLSIRLQAVSTTGTLAANFSSAMAAVAGAWFALAFARQVCRPRGLGLSHFHWPSSAVRGLHQGLAWLTPPLLVLIILMEIVSRAGDTVWRNSLGRVLFFLILGLGMWFAHRLLHPRRGVLVETMTNAPTGWRNPLRTTIYLVGVLTPLFIILMAASGYSFTAEELAKKLAESVGVLALIFFIESLLARYVLMNQRRTAIQQAQQRREEEASETSILRKTSDGQIISDTLDPEEISRFTAQAHRSVWSLSLLGATVGLWLIWRDVFPAFAALDRVLLWDQISLSDLLVSLAILVISIVASLNLPGMLEIGVLRRLSLDAGLRYAIVTITRYVLAIVGVTLALNWLGFGWSRLQWLVAAMGVGLGFGLQEIVANFVSGLIILFERPLRVGDIITIGDVTGTVTKIRIRATTILDFDRKELIVPNKDFVTQKLLNWTLTDEVNRVTVTVGVAYGTNIRLAHKLLVEACQKTSGIVSEPQPLINLDRFGESSLDFIVRVYLPNLENRLQTIHELHANIQENFEEHGIEIAFPQLDVHIRSNDTGASVVSSESGDSP